MRILVMGAGAVGGYFGGRLLEAGRDVTFLVRPARAAELSKSGLIIRSRLGDVSILNPPTVLAETVSAPFDVVLLSSKAYDLEGAMAAFRPAVGPRTSILPLLNGMRHIDTLRGRFGADRVLGGQCVISATLNDLREIVHLNEAHRISFGELDGGMSPRVNTLEKVLQGARFDVQATPHILLEMWEKWVLLATLAGATCMMRAAVCDIVASPGGTGLILGLLEECRATASAEGYEPRPQFLDRARGMLTAADSPFTASMLRDIEVRAPIEADHIIGDLLERARLRQAKHSILAIVYTHLKAYEARRIRN